MGAQSGRGSHLAPGAIGGGLGVQNETDAMSPAGEYVAAVWDANCASGELPLCSVQSAAVNGSTYRGVKDSWKKESWPACSSGPFVANTATSGSFGCRLPTTAPPAEP